MNVIRLSLRNYRVFEEVDLEIPARVIGIFGPNGSGKTTLVESVLFGLYGETRTHRNQVRTHGILTDCEVRVEFHHGGREYAVTRRIRGKNHQTEAELTAGDLSVAVGVTDVNREIERLLHMDHRVFRASVFAEQKQLDAFSDVSPGERKKMVLRLLGIQPVDVARAEARKEARDTKGDAERMAGALPDTADQEQALEEAKAAATEAEARATAAREALTESEGAASAAAEAFTASDEARQRMDKIEVERAQLASQADTAERRATELGERLSSLKEALDAGPVMEKERSSLAGAAERLTNAIRAAETADAARTLDRELETLPPVDAPAAATAVEEAREALDAARKGHARAETAHERALQDLAQAREGLERADEADPAQPCPTCGRPLGDDFEEYRRHCRERAEHAARLAEEAATVLREAVGAVTRTENEHDRATAEAERARGAAEERTRLERRRTEITAELEGLLEPFGGRAPDTEVLAREAQRYEELGKQLARLEGAREQAAQAEADRAGALEEAEKTRTRITELDDEATGLAFDPKEHAALQVRRDETAAGLETARREEREASDDHKAVHSRLTELQAEIRKVKEIRAKAGELLDEARYLDRVGMLLEGFRGHLYGRIVPELSREAEAIFRELTAGEYEGLDIDAETLGIRIADGTSYFPIERFSGSETDLANLALRVAISEHLSRMSATDVGMMVLDEVLASLDAERKDLFVQTMGRLAGRFHQVFVITHAEQVKDQFPASVEVRRTGRRRSQAVLV